MEGIVQTRATSQASTRGTAVNNVGEPVRYRAACDRCHGKKIRCRKEPGAKNCVECTRHTVDCRFAIFRKDIGRSQSLHPKTTTSTESRRVDLEEEVNLIGAEKVSLGSVVECTKKRKAPQSINLNSELDSPQRQTQLSADLVRSDQNCSSDTLSLYHDMTTDASFTNFGFGGSVLHPYDPQLDFILPDSLTSGYHQSDSFLSEIDTLRMAPVVSTQKRLDLSPLVDVTYFGSKNSLVSLQNSSLPDHSYIQNTQSDARPDRSMIIPPGRLPPDQQQAEHSGGNGNDNDAVYHKSRMDLFNTLNKLNLDLYNHKSTIPSQSIHDFELKDNLPMGRGAEQWRKYPLDDTFQLTQTLVNLYPRFMETFMTTPPTFPITSCLGDNAQGSIPNGSIYGHTIAHPGARPREASAPASVAIDHSSVFLLVSCHTCLIEIYEEILQHSVHCEDNIGITKESEFLSPALKLGKYAPPLSVAIPMLMLMLDQMASQLLDHANTLVACLEELRSNIENRNSDHRVGAQNLNTMSLPGAKAVQKRASQMYQRIADLRKTVLGKALLA